LGVGWLVLLCGCSGAAFTVGPEDDAGDARAEAAPDAQPMEAGQDAGREAETDGPSCVTDLSNVGVGDFHVRLSIVTTSTAAAAVVGQRGPCAYSVYWDVHLLDGYVLADTDDGTMAGRVLLAPGRFSVADGKKHEVTVGRVAGVLSIAVDGVLAGSMPDPDYLGPMPALAIGSDSCNPGPFSGQITDVCLTIP
jgi:hypothetical protein